VLNELGFNADEIAGLHASGVLGKPKPQPAAPATKSSASPVAR
jgi:hypothetical protein